MQMYLWNLSLISLLLLCSCVFGVFRLVLFGLGFLFSLGLRLPYFYLYWDDGLAFVSDLYGHGSYFKIAYLLMQLQTYIMNELIQGMSSLGR